MALTEKKKLRIMFLKIFLIFKFLAALYGRILVPWPMELIPPAVEAQSPNHCTAGEFQELFVFF